MRQPAANSTSLRSSARWRFSSQGADVTGASAAKSSDAIFAANRAVGSIALSVKNLAGRTRRDHVHEAGSLRVRCPGSPARELEAVIINTAGGAAGGDRFDFDFTAGAGDSLLVTPAAGQEGYCPPWAGNRLRGQPKVAAGAAA